RSCRVCTSSRISRCSSFWPFMRQSSEALQEGSKYALLLPPVATFCLVAGSRNGSAFAPTSYPAVTCAQITPPHVRSCGNAPLEKCPNYLYLKWLRGGHLLPGG